jgi:hypothetical protein
VTAKEGKMSKRIYLGEIEGIELSELFESKNRINALKDLIRTLNDPEPVVLHILEGISTDQVEKEINEAVVRKNEKFSEIYDKHEWMHVTGQENIFISEEGKVYQTCSGDDCKCNSNTCRE